VVEAAHCTVTVHTEESPEFTKMGYLTWRCASCGIWRVPGAPFSKDAREKKIFLTTCTFGDTGTMCCNCERNKELINHKGRTLQLIRGGPKLLDPPVLLLNAETREAVWDKEQGHTMEDFKLILKEGKHVESEISATAWYSEMACNHCRHRVGLKTHETLARERVLAAQQRILEAQAAAAKKKKGKKKK